MAPRQSSNHEMGSAGQGPNRSKSRGRRYFKQGDSDVTSHNTLGGEQTTNLNPFCKDSTAAHLEGMGGLSSRELALVFDNHHRRGRRHICHGQTVALAAKTPSTPSCVSEPISEDSAMDHLGHRDKVKDERWKELLEATILEEEEPTSGVSSHHLSRRKGRLGYGKRHYAGTDYKWVGYHRARAINDPGGEDCLDNKKGSWMGPAKRRPATIGLGAQIDNLFDDTIPEKERHTKKMFMDRFEEAVHASEEIPIGVSSQIDLHTRGFLGKSKHNFGGMMQVSSDPITDKSAEPKDVYDLTSYGLGHRGKRKFLVQNNLEAGCRHNMSRPESKSTPTLRSASVPVLERDLPPNQTPYWQDDLPEEQRAQKSEMVGACMTGREMDRNLKPRSCAPPKDNTWSTLTWTPRKMDAKSAAQFIEGQNELYGISDLEHKEQEFRISIGETKRSFGNAHNQSQFRFDYADDPTWKTEHIQIVKQHLPSDMDDDNRKTERTLHWGHGRGRRKFDIPDHLDKAADGVECYASVSGATLGRVKHVDVPDHIVFGGGGDAQPVFFMDPDGRCVKTTPRPYRVPKDTLDELFDVEVQSENSNTMAVVGQRRMTETIRPKSARRFPQKDFEKVTPRSVTPRAASEARTPLNERPRWKK